MTQQPHASDAGPRVTREQVRDVRTIRRARDDRMVAGVCEGLSRHLDVDPLVVRVVFAALTLFGGAGVVLYCLAWITIPSEDSYDSTASAWLRRDPDRILVAGLAIAAVAATATMIGAIGFSAPNPFPAIVIGLLALILFAVLTRRPHDSAAVTPSASPDDEATAVLPTTSTDQAEHTAPLPVDEPRKVWWRRPDGTGAGGPAQPRTPAPPPPPRPRRPRREPSRLLSATLAAIALALGTVWVIDETVVAQMPPSVYPGTALGLIAVALLMGTRFGRSRFLIFLGLVATFLTVVSTVVGPGPYGEASYRPTAAADVQTTYRHGAGLLTVRLDDVQDPTSLDGRVIEVDSSVGQVDVIVPSSVDATIRAHVDGGEITGPAYTGPRSGGSQSATLIPRDDDDPDVTIDIELTFGQINIMLADCPGDGNGAVRAGIFSTYQPFDALTGGTRVPSACN
ncbi:MAG: PspC domain-containing protein [Nocardioidaceae bacterium]|nr:PspC domain-containing protein [Nocardioidaceae bacterium]